jgi:uncharacterized protein (DUF1330 family)
VTGYLIFIRERTTDQVELETYAAMVPPTLQGHNATVLIRYGSFEVLEGDAMEGAILLQFPSIEEAKAYYDSPAYQNAAVHRHAGADYRAILIEGAA